MSDTSETPETVEDTAPETEETVTATVPKDSALPAWLTSLPPAVQPYVALSRLDRPVGIWLLLLPCWIGVLFTTISTGFNIYFPLWIVLFAIGAVAMRGAGCTWNDITDRKIDAGVERTAGRPLPSGQVSVTQAWLWMGAQVFVGFLVWLCLPLDAKIVALFSIPLVVAYPYMKRLIWWPQGWLGLTFNFGVLIAALTVGNLGWTLAFSSIVLWLGLACWTVAYDTIYALQDVEDDALMGVKSTARLFGDRAVLGAFCFHLAAGAIIALAAMSVGAERVGGLTAIAFIAHGVWQVWRLRDKSHSHALSVFKSNVWAGTILIVGFFIAALLPGSGS